MTVVKRWLPLLAAFYVVFLVLKLPAADAWLFLQKRLPAQAAGVAMIGGEGSWVVGRFRSVVYNGTDLGSLSWRLRPLVLLTGRLGYAVAGENGGEKLSGEVSLGWRGIRINNLQGTMPLALLKGYLPGVELAGKLSSDTIGLRFGGNRLLAAQGRLEWREAGVLSPVRVGLGGFAAVLSTEQGKIKAILADLGGEVLAEGIATLDEDGRYSFTGGVGVRSTASPDLAAYMQVLGEPKADGRIPLNYNGRLTY